MCSERKSQREQSAKSKQRGKKKTNEKISYYKSKPSTEHSSVYNSKICNIKASAAKSLHSTSTIKHLSSSTLPKREAQDKKLRRRRGLPGWKQKWLTLRRWTTICSTRLSTKNRNLCLATHGSKCHPNASGHVYDNSLASGLWAGKKSSFRHKW